MACVAVFEEEVRRIKDYTLPSLRDLGVSESTTWKVERALQEHCSCARSGAEAASCVFALDVVDLLNLGYPKKAEKALELIEVEDLKDALRRLIEEYRREVL